VTIAFESPDRPEVIALIAELDSYQDALYPGESRNALDMDSLKHPQCLVCRGERQRGEAIGCGAVVLYAEYGELKRMYVRPRGRRRDVAKELLSVLGPSGD
jgi:putative acetyltransferase